MKPAEQKYAQRDVPWICPRCEQTWLVDVLEGVSLDDLDCCPACNPEMCDLEGADVGTEVN